MTVVSSIGVPMVQYTKLFTSLYHYPLRGHEQAEHLYEKRIKAAIETNKDEDLVGNG
ncbi:MAG: hypothetical protein JW755_12650 [Candidatus Aminicenantes bacterium]|nr:hypothetical protein [Candidatus Aminicenantes bacterium]